MTEETQPPENPQPEEAPPPSPDADSTPEQPPPESAEPEAEPGSLAAGEGAPTPPSWMNGRLAIALAGVVAILAAVVIVIAVTSGGSDDTSGSPTPVGQTPGPSAPPVAGEPNTLADGLQVITIKDGTGATPQAHETVTVNYSGYLRDGGEFDSSLGPGRTPFAFVLGEQNVIPGWDEGVPMMKVGGSYRLIIPPALGYGESGSPPVIPANATLIFDIDVISSEPPTPTPTPFATVNSTPPPAAAQPTVLPDGLQIVTLTEGTGAQVQAHDTVTLNYTGWVQGGGEFDSSLRPGRTPFKFVLGEQHVITGFDEGVALMKIGGTYRLIIPPALGYGADGSPPVIPGNATLIFDITIVDSQPPTPAPTPTVSS